ncbi:MAG: hypothetical protein GC164_13660 [Phycisphaera sp.]|nr:hypothetical protein [Phycisphaera sp.]
MLNYAPVKTPAPRLIRFFTRPSLTLALGLALILTCEALLAVDVHLRGGLIVGHNTPAEALPDPVGYWGTLARYVAQNMTPLCWVGYLLVFDGLLTVLAHKKQDRSISSLRARPHRFLIAWLTSIPVWCYFDFVNFYFMDAWRYHGLPEAWWSRAGGYFIAFAAISPGMFLAAQTLQHVGLRRLRTRGVRIPRFVEVGCVLLGVLFVVYPFVVHDAIGNLTLWVSLMFFLDPINHWLGAPSILGDWKAGRWGRTLSLMLGGAVCGFCWEFWNYYAVTKWTYHLPFTGTLEQYRYFEMPWIGFQGFLPFAIECWVVLNTIVWVMDRLGLHVAEPLPDEYSVM